MVKNRNKQKDFQSKKLVIGKGNHLKLNMDNHAAFLYP